MLGVVGVVGVDRLVVRSVDVRLGRVGLVRLRLGAVGLIWVGGEGGVPRLVLRLRTVCGRVLGKWVIGRWVVGGQVLDRPPWAGSTAGSSSTSPATAIGPFHFSEMCGTTATTARGWSGSCASSSSRGIQVAEWLA